MANDEIMLLSQKIAPMKPSVVKPTSSARALQRLESLYDSSEYIAEDKIDGCHYMAISHRFFSTDGHEKTDNYPHLVKFLRSLNMPNLILDGEINYPGKTSQYCTHVTGTYDSATAISFQRSNGFIHYTMWDMLRTPKGTWLVNEPLWKRRQMLEHFYNNFVVGTPYQEYIHLTKWIVSDKRRFRDDIFDRGEEGVVLKNKNGIYIMGKKPAWNWVKIKTEDTADLFISGYEAASRDYTGQDFDNWPYWREINGVKLPVSKYFYMNWIGALELSAYVNGKKTRICSCSGISEALREQISNNPDMFLDRVVKISYMERTEDGYPRHPRFEDFHESKVAAECDWSFESDEEDDV